MRANHSHTSGRQCLGPKELAPTNHESNVKRHRVEYSDSFVVVNVADFVDGQVKPAQSRGVFDAATASGASLRFESDDTFDSYTRFQQSLECGDTFHVDANPPNPQILFQRPHHRTSLTAQINRSWSPSCILV